MSDERSHDTRPEAPELTDDELDSVTGGIGGIMGEAVRPVTPSKLDVAVLSDTFPRRNIDPSIGKL